MGGITRSDERLRVRAVIGELIDYLDVLDGDADIEDGDAEGRAAELEPDADHEPSLGWSEQGAQVFGGAAEDLED